MVNTGKKHMRFVFLLGILFSGATYAQDSAMDSVVIHKDPRLDSLIKVQIRINELTTRDSRRNQPGFRIQVANSTDRTQVFAIKTRIYQQYPELKPYLVYQPPYYKLNVGNFKNPEEAQPYIEKLTKYFPSGVYLIHDIIELNPSNP
jgi:ribosomal protein S16